ncbi:MAG TPA: hypothetical protein VFF79_12570 [Conexibacter sp.]|nr:hypothetical protein [Conexibacter sp.]
MSYRLKNGSWIVEIYDPAVRGKRHVRPADFDMEPPRNERQARALERAALNARDDRRPDRGEETIASFGDRWTTDFPRGESTNVHHDQQVKAFVAAYGRRLLRSITRREGRRWGNDHPSHVPALRLMYNDSIRDKLADDNPFAALGIERRRGRKDITVLTLDEVELLGEIALALFGEVWGPYVRAMILWGAYTCSRTGETFVARHDLLDGDVFYLEEQYNSRLRKVTEPKHGSTGTIYVPPPARDAVAALPRRLGDNLMWRTKRGKPFTQPNWSPTWRSIRTVFLDRLPRTHHLWRRLARDHEDVLDFYELRHFGASYMLNVLEIEPWVIARQLRHSDTDLIIELYGHPEEGVAIDRMRRAWTRRAAQLRGMAGGAAVRAAENLGGSA